MISYTLDLTFFFASEIRLRGALPYSIFIFVSYFMSCSNHFLQNTAHRCIAFVLQKLVPF